MQIGIPHFVPLFVKSVTAGFVMSVLWLAPNLSAQTTNLNNQVIIGVYDAGKNWRHIGQGHTRARGENCFVITPEHVVKQGRLRNTIAIRGTPGELAQAEFEQVLGNDLAVYRVNTNQKAFCNPRKYQHIAEDGFFLVARDKLGNLNQEPTYIASQNLNEYIVDTTRMNISKGDSGSAFASDGKKIGMFLSVDGNTAKVLKTSVIEQRFAEKFVPPNNSITGQNTKTSLPDIFKLTTLNMLLLATYDVTLDGEFKRTTFLKNNIASVCQFDFTYNHTSKDHNPRNFKASNSNNCKNKEANELSLRHVAFLAPRDRDGSTKNWVNDYEDSDTVVFKGAMSEGASITGLPKEVNPENLYLQFTFDKSVPYVKHARIYSLKTFQLRQLPPSHRASVTRDISFKLNKIENNNLPTLDKVTTTIEVFSPEKESVIKVITEEIIKNHKYKKKIL